MTIESNEEVEVLILGNLLLVCGGIAAAFGLTSLASGGISLALIGLFMAFLGGHWLVKAFRKYQWDDLKLVAKTAWAMAREDAEAKYGKQ